MKIHALTVGPMQENCYIVIDEVTNRAAIVDPGDEGARIVQEVRDAGVDVEAIWLTHAHIDHIGAINDVHAAFPVGVHLHPLDLPYYDDLSAKAAVMYGLPWDQPTVATTALAHEQVVQLGNLEFNVMHTPGHAAGHVAFVGHGIALAGDLLFAGSIGRTDLPLSDPYAMDTSLELFSGLPPETIVYPGHGPSTTIGRELATNPFLSGRARTLKR